MQPERSERRRVADDALDCRDRRELRIQLDVDREAALVRGRGDDVRELDAHSRAHVDDARVRRPDEPNERLGDETARDEVAHDVQAPAPDASWGPRSDEQLATDVP